VKYLLDVNILLAWRHRRAPHHQIFHSWAAATGFEHLATCALSELGFIRVSMQAFDYTLRDSQSALAEIKRAAGGFIAAAPSPILPAWSATAARTSDAYLIQLAISAGLKLATFDLGIPGAAFIGA
jgi:predicted nucleic acid-binding protein